MNTHNRTWFRSVTLILLALSAGMAWRVELEFRSGWDGLAWLDYFHWAPPVCVLAFVVWAVCVAPVRRPLMFASALSMFAVAAYIAVDFAFRIYFARGPYAMITVINLGGGDFEAGLERMRILATAGPVCWALIPLAFCAICRGFGAAIKLRAALSSAVLFVISWPIATILITFSEHRASADFIHALKSGFVIPFLVVSLGLPLLISPADSRMK
jgi:hypothetical protein